jgi:hypothetical protein
MVDAHEKDVRLARNASGAHGSPGAKWAYAAPAEALVQLRVHGLTNRRLRSQKDQQESQSRHPQLAFHGDLQVLKSRVIDLIFNNVTRREYPVYHGGNAVEPQSTTSICLNMSF